MKRTYDYRGHLSQFEGIIAFMLMTAWSISSIALVGAQNGAVA